MREVGVHAVINKPWDVEELRETLRLALKQTTADAP